jgi:glycosyltransferase involved in cell wall biosynthesis
MATILLVDEDIALGGGVRTVIQSIIKESLNHNYLYLNLTNRNNILFEDTNFKSFSPFINYQYLAKNFKFFRLLFSLAIYRYRKTISVIYVHQPVSLVIGVFLGWLFSIPVVYHCHGLSGFAEVDKLGFIFRVALKKVNTVIAISHFVKNQLLSVRSIGTVDVIYNWADALDVQNSVRSTSIDFLFLGRLCREKAPHTFVNSLLSQNFNFSACIAGPIEDVDYANQLLCKVSEDSRFSYVGLLSHNDAMALLETAKYLIVPSQWGEPFGLVVVEAMQRGVLVIARKDGAIPEIIEHGMTGYLFEKDEDLSYLIKNLSNYDLDTIAVRAKKRVMELFNPKIQLPKILEKIVENNL